MYNCRTTLPPQGHFEQALEIAKSIDDRVGEFESLNLLAQVHQAQNNNEQAEEYAAQAAALQAEVQAEVEAQSDAPTTTEE